MYHGTIFNRTDGQQSMGLLQKLLRWTAPTAEVAASEDPYRAAARAFLKGDLVERDRQLAMGREQYMNRVLQEEASRAGAEHIANSGHR